MKVLSLFDGLAGCRIALDRVGITQTKYYSSEIDKYAMQVASHNYPDIIHVGSVTDWQSWDVDWSSINLVTGGFPCQAWSVAGKQGGDKDERGMLFWTMLDVMKMVLRHNPKAKFMMENVKMKKEFEEYITFHTQEALGHVNKILINSALVSAQNRNRWYWTNIDGVEQPEDLGLVLADVIENGEVDREKSLSVTTRVAGATAKRYLEKSMHQMVIETQGPCAKQTVTATIITKDGECFSGTNACENPQKECPRDVLGMKSGEGYHLCKEVCNQTAHAEVNAIKLAGEKANGSVLYLEGHSYACDNCKGHAESAGISEIKISAPPLNFVIGRIVGRKINPETGKRDDYNRELMAEQRVEPRFDEKSGTLTTVQKDNVLIVREATKKGFVEIKPGQCVDLTFPTSKTRRGRKMEFKSNCLTAANHEYSQWNGLTYRKLTPLECERLQTLPDNYTLVLDENGKQLVSNSQRYKMIGNGWTIDVIAHIFRGLKNG